MGITIVDGEATEDNSEEAPVSGTVVDDCEDGDAGPSNGKDIDSSSRRSDEEYFLIRFETRDGPPAFPRESSEVLIAF